MLKKIKEKLKARKKGVTSLEVVIGTVIFLMCFAALLDMLILSNRYSVMNNTAKELARTLSVQGGALTKKPGAYTSNYYTIDQLAANIRANMKAAGFDDGEYTVMIEADREFNDNETVIYDAAKCFGIVGFTDSKEFRYAPTKKLDYLSRFDVRICAKYEWRALPSFIGARTSMMQVSMPGLSEWKYNYDKWESESGEFDV